MEMTRKPIEEQVRIVDKSWDEVAIGMGRLRKALVEAFSEVEPKLRRRKLETLVEPVFVSVDELRWDLFDSRGEVITQEFLHAVE